MGDVDFAESRKATQKFFTRILRKHGDGPKAVGYGRKESQRRRFEVFAQNECLDSRSVLDVGCGLGHFFDFLRSQDLHVSYTGIDINKSSILTANRAHTGVRFAVRDLLEQPYKEEFNWVFASGIFNIPIPDYTEYMLQTLRAMFEACTHGIGVNFVSEYTPYSRNKETVYTDPIEILRYALQELSSKVTLRQDYLPNDFTIFVYKGEV